MVNVKYTIFAFFSVLICSTAILLFINTNSGKQINAIPVANAKPLEYGANKKQLLYNLEHMSLEQYERFHSLEEGWKLGTDENKSLPNEEIVKESLTIMFDRFDKNGINNLLNGFLQVYIVDGTIQKSDGGFLAGLASLENGYYEVYLFRATSASDTKKLYHTLVHEVGHLIYANYIIHPEMLDYLYTRNIPIDYYTESKWKEGKDKNVYEMFADDVADWVLPYSYETNKVIVGKGFKNQQEEDVFRDFLVRSIKNN